MKKWLQKLIMTSTIALAGFALLGCTPYQEGLATGVVVGAGTTAVGYENNNRDRYRATRYRDNRSRHRRGYYDIGYRNGCTSARGRWYKNSYQWRRSANYRSGWRAGYSRCR